MYVDASDTAQRRTQAPSPPRTQDARAPTSRKPADLQKPVWRTVWKYGKRSREDLRKRERGGVCPRIFIEPWNAAEDDEDGETVRQTTFCTTKRNVSVGSPLAWASTLNQDRYEPMLFWLRAGPLWSGAPQAPRLTDRGACGASGRSARGGVDLAYINLGLTEMGGRVSAK